MAEAIGPSTRVRQPALPQIQETDYRVSLSSPYQFSLSFSHSKDNFKKTRYLSNVKYGLFKVVNFQVYRIVICICILVCVNYLSYLETNNFVNFEGIKYFVTSLMSD